MYSVLAIRGLTKLDLHAGDKANHVPAFHVPQMYYFFAFATVFGWPALASGDGGILGLAQGVGSRMFGTRK